MKVQYSGLSDVRVIPAADTINGAVPGGAGQVLTFNKANAWIIDSTVAPYNTAATGNVLTALVALPNGEFKDVTGGGSRQWHVYEYGS